MSQVRLAVFASGRGTNASRIFEYFSGHSRVRVVLLVCNRREAPVLQIAERVSIPGFLSDPKFEEIEKVLQVLTKYKVDCIALAGFLRLIPKEIIQKFKGKIFNLHPSILPKYGGAGMYGMRVHTQVLRDQVECTGITIHLVNEKYDQGDILCQARIQISECRRRSVEWIAQRVAALEHQHYPRVILETIEKTICPQSVSL